MNKLAVLAAGLLMPASLFGELNIDVHINGNANIQPRYSEPATVEVEYDYEDDGDPWFEELPSQGPVEVSYEYQWTYYGPNRVLRFRKVNFNYRTDQWTFGPWMIKEHVCHHSCNLHHRHVYFQARGGNHRWVRNHENVNGRVTYFYEFRRPDVVRNARPNVYRYEYQPPHHRHHDHHPQVERSYQHQDNHGQGNRREEYHDNNQQRTTVKEVDSDRIGPNGLSKTKTKIITTETQSDDDDNNNRPSRQRNR